eukprot:TRINITY_DN3558_c0_g1_i4.p1 TRINITY_DN3558_c0_g1~~TRINITY_DN3558_c0_g1_i4.p1  ORF type:complete len:462 (-),score=-28.77 TRINITY_DN3558_c0_g1_i4:102-1487(-)
MRLKFFWLLLFLCTFPSSLYSFDCRYYSGSSDDTDEYITGVIFEIVGSIAGEFPGGSIFAGALSILHQSIFRDRYNMGTNDVLCYISKYMSDQFAKNMQTFERWYDTDKENCTQMELMLSQMEAVTLIDKLRVSRKEDKARWYNIIIPWTILHLGVYEKIINNQDCSIHSAKGGISTIKAKSDEWLLFYSKLLLRYYRPYKHMRFKTEDYLVLRFSNMNKLIDYHETLGSIEKEKKDYLKIIPAPAIVQQWEEWAWYSKTKGELKKLHETCTAKSGNAIQLSNFETGFVATVKKDYGFGRNHWLSCWGSGSRCKIRTCPHILEYNTTLYRDHWKCRGETFWIYSDSEWIKHNQQVHFQYSIKSRKGYWLSRYKSIWHNTAWADTKTCPGKEFTGIRQGCDKELFNTYIGDRSVTEYPHVYDGDFIILGFHKKPPYEIYLYGCESLEKGTLSQPFTYVQARG